MTRQTNLIQIFLRRLPKYALGFMLSATSLEAQAITGVVNAYVQITGIPAANQVTVTNSAGYVAGNRVLVIQMQGATVSNVNNATGGNITALNNAGNFEFADIASVAGNTITLTTNLCKTYTPGQGLQLVRVPVYANPTINGPLTALPWNGIIGGVVAIEVTGTLTMNAGVNVQGQGFRGGAVVTGGFDCGNNPWVGNVGGTRGEAIAAYQANLARGRAPLANGGGGSTPSNPGAGGGGLMGAGGRGGNFYSGCGGASAWGEGGLVLAPNSDRAYMGGGGGGGYADNGQPTAPGANGGGIVLIVAPTIVCNGNPVINAAGNNVTVLTRDEGAGAGGGGGSVYIWSNTITNPLTVNVQGGNGGNISNTLFSTQCHGPGGGGGGGLVWLSQAGPPAGFTTQLNGGIPGIVQSNGAGCVNTPYGAAPGGPGSILYNLPPLPSPATLVNLGNDTTLCPGFNLTLSTPNTFSAYTWSTGAQTPTITVSTPGIYWLEVPDGCGNLQRDSIIVSQFSNPVSLGNDTSLCQGQSLTLSVPSGLTSVLWSTGATTQSISITQAGQYWVEVTDTNNCGWSGSIALLQIHPLPIVNLGPDQWICPGASPLLDAGPGQAQYLWNTGATSQTIQPQNPGTYFVSVTSAQGCSASDTLVLTLADIQNFTLGPDLQLCPGESFTLNAGAGWESYLWNNGTTTQTFSGTAPGTYTVVVTQGNNCQATASVQVNYFAPAAFTLGNDTSLCEGQTLNLSLPANWSTIQWSTGSIQPSITLSTAGPVGYTANDGNGCPVSGGLVVTNVFPSPTFAFGPDVSFCQGDTFALIGPAGMANYLWNTGNTGLSIVPATPGIYWLEVSDQNACSWRDSIRVLAIHPRPEVSLGDDFTFCPDDPVELSPVPPVWDSYSWSTGSLQPSILLTDSGTVSLVVTNAFGCAAKAEIRARFRCQAILYVPNAFTPNEDPINPAFRAYGRHIKDFKMDIFNRWGQRIYTSNALEHGWDGRMDANLIAPNGIYTYRIVYSDFISSDEKTLSGRISLLR